MEFTNENKQFEVAEIHLPNKSKVKASVKPKISSSDDAEKILRETWNLEKLELIGQFKILLVNTYKSKSGATES